MLTDGKSLHTVFSQLIFRTQRNWICVSVLWASQDTFETTRTLGSLSFLVFLWAWYSLTLGRMCRDVHSRWKVSLCVPVCFRGLPVQLVARWSWSRSSPDLLGRSSTRQPAVCLRPAGRLRGSATLLQLWRRPRGVVLNFLNTQTWLLLLLLISESRPFIWAEVFRYDVVN